LPERIRGRKVGIKVARRLLTIVLGVVVALVVVGCGGGGGGGSADNSSKTLTLGIAAGWTENVAITNLTKVIFEEDLGYKEVEAKTLDLALVFEGVAGGDLQAFQDVWLPNHRQLLSEVKSDVEQLPPWYEGETTFGLAVPDYMSDVKSIADLNESGATEIIGIDPGAIISQTVPDKVIPAYNLKLEYKPSSTAAMLQEAERLYEDKEPFVFPPWCPSTHCESYENQNPKIDYHYLKDPKNAMGNLDYGPQSDTSASISSIVSEDLRDDDPVAYAFIKNLKLNQEELLALENMQAKEGALKGAKTWLEDNRDVVQPAIDAAKKAQ
jgi:glycine betaine/proline transport system substrate-binding protein